MQQPVSFEDLIAKAEALNLYQNLVIQVNKDFLLANIDLDFEVDILPSSMKYLLHEVVFKLIQEKFADYLNLLYIIDVSEEKIKQLDGSDTLVLSEQVTFLILQREWQKVWFRNHYKS
ncbi:hypothetical protein [Psychroserpens algicola]|uniref:Uncharacterized protein n=1 Tax=Psychroserpens algicola TaxID=1719034 RepID=A0ABT0H9H9_9FLAO|nr:hypothetical protein [Psychroserpens algicola]MCK8481016.1 hypothetical protein [Psychroserpens algicola]